LREVGDGGGVLDGEIEAVELFQEFRAAEALRGERVNDLLDFGGDDVAPGEVGVVEDGAEQPFGEHGLHFLDGGVGEVRIEFERPHDGIGCSRVASSRRAL